MKRKSQTDKAAQRVGGSAILPRINNQRERKLTPAQRSFNRLISQVEALRSNLKAETENLDRALAFYSQHLRHRIQREIEVRKDLVRTLAPFLDEQKLKKKSHRKTLRHIIAAELAHIQDDAGQLEDEDLQKIFGQIHHIDYRDAERQDFEDVRSTVEQMMADHFGVNVDLSEIEPDMDEEEMFSRIAEMEGQIRDQIQEPDPAGEQSRPKSKRALEEERRQLEAAELRKKSLTSIYRQLAKALHPDLEQDPEERIRKVVLMQELTAAYRQNDLHTMLRLELEWIHGEEQNLERLADDKLAVYNEVLKEQIAELRMDLEMLPHNPRYASLVIEGDFDFEIRTDDPRQLTDIDARIAGLEQSIATLRAPDGLKHLIDLLREQAAMERRQRKREEEEDWGDLPF